MVQAHYPCFAGRPHRLQLKRFLELISRFHQFLPVTRIEVGIHFTQVIELCGGVFSAYCGQKEMLCRFSSIAGFQMDLGDEGMRLGPHCIGVVSCNEISIDRFVVTVQLSVGSAAIAREQVITITQVGMEIADFRSADVILLSIVSCCEQSQDLCSGFAMPVFTFEKP